MVENISVNILAENQNQKGKRILILLTISIVLIFIVPYPMNLLLGESILFKMILAVLFINVSIWGLYYKFTDKFEIIGKIVFGKNELIISYESKTTNYKISDISNLTILYYGYSEEPYLALLRSARMNSATGEDNVLSFQSFDKNYRYKFSIPNKTIKTFLLRQVDNYIKNGSDVKIIEQENFVEF